MQNQKTVVFARGDGIGPEIMEATLSILQAAQVDLNFKEVMIGQKAYQKGCLGGIPDDALATIEKHRILLKAPMTTPQGGGYKSLNVTLRSKLNLFANIRPCYSLDGIITTLHPKTNLVIVRENQEGLYTGVEYQSSSHTIEAIKTVTTLGVERIVRYAFEFAKANNRKKVTAMSKDNILKKTDGLFHQIFEKIAKEYPNIESDHRIIDIGAAKIGAHPELFDVIVTLNLYGDIISDIAAEATGSVGVAGSANLGLDAAMFEAVHGSAPDIANQNLANPSGLLLAAIYMLNHLGLTEKAEMIGNAWLKTLEDGYHPADIYDAKSSKQKVGTKEFSQTIIDHLGQTATRSDLFQQKMIAPQMTSLPALKKGKIIGVDIYFADIEGPKTLTQFAKTADQNKPQNSEIKFLERGFVFDSTEKIAIQKSDLIEVQLTGNLNWNDDLIFEFIQKMNAAGFVFSKLHKITEYQN